MTDFVTIRRNLESEKERIRKMDQTVIQKLASTITDIETALSFLDKSEKHYQELEAKLNDKKREEIQLQNEKKDLLSDIETLKENIERIKHSINDEEEKAKTLNQELMQLNTQVQNNDTNLKQTKAMIDSFREKNQSKKQELIDTRSSMESRINHARQALADLQKEEEQNIKISPVIDFLLKEVRIDIPEVEILSVLAYRNQAIGIEDLKKAVSKTPPVIILKVLRNLDSKGIIKYDERLDTIEITANLV